MVKFVGSAWICKIWKGPSTPKVGLGMYWSFVHDIDLFSILWFQSCFSYIKLVWLILYSLEVYYWVWFLSEVSSSSCFEILWINVTLNMFIMIIAYVFNVWLEAVTFANWRTTSNCTSWQVCLNNFTLI